MTDLTPFLLVEVDYLWWPSSVKLTVNLHPLTCFVKIHVFLLEDVWMPLTVLATRETLYLLEEDHQWRKSGSTANGSDKPCSGSFTILETLPISCVSSVLLWPADQCRMDLKLYDEVSTSSWNVKLCSLLLLLAVSAQDNTLRILSFPSAVIASYCIKK